MESFVTDCSVQPMIPEGWSIHSEDQIARRFHGKFVWDSNKVVLHFDDAQKPGGAIVGDRLLNKLVDQRVLPANVLDFLLDHQALIPSWWERYRIFFWGTVYRRCDGLRCVRSLEWGGGLSWHGRDRSLGSAWYAVNPAAVLAK